jgi:hypothetical protein
MEDDFVIRMGQSVSRVRTEDVQAKEYATGSQEGEIELEKVVPLV